MSIFIKIYLNNCIDYLVMFTGIVRLQGTINFFNLQENLIKLGIEINNSNFILNIGDSVCINGICLTVINIIKNSDNNFQVFFDIMNETIKKTTVLNWKINDIVNIEYSTKSNELNFDGYIVLGHVDSIAKLINIKDNEFIFEINDNSYNHCLIDKGSICVDGVSLTIVNTYNNIFSVCIIPHTFQNTIFQYYNNGINVNVEFDIKLKKNNFIPSLSSINNLTILSDEHAMYIACQLGEMGRNTCKPNPWVGCIIVYESKIIGHGYHKKAGEAHAEVLAIKNCIENGNYDKLSSSTMYITLEPCCHYGRTPPCVNSIITEKIKKICVGIEDPDERVKGNGIKKCLSNNINIVLLNSDFVKKSLEPYIFYKKFKKPYVYLKIASTLDGKICAQDLSSKWITSEKARNDSKNILRTKCDTLLTSSKTIINDKPNYYEISDITILDHKKLCGDELLKKYNNKNINIINTFSNNFDDYLDEIYLKNKMEVLVECGSNITSSFIKQNCWNELWIYINMSYLGNFGKSFIDEDLGYNIKDLKKIGEIVNIEQIDTENIKIIIKNEKYKDI